jgi:formylglycine-generating enzyme required for sulfatase activity
LPTEAEWEYAARAGGLGEVFPGNLASIAWIDRNSAAQTQDVGEKIPNAWGLYDMYGNVFEWVQDWYSGTYYTTGAVTNPSGPPKGERRVLRGGSWLYGPEYARPSIRFFNIPALKYFDLGFRCARQKIEAR